MGREIKLPNGIILRIGNENSCAGCINRDSNRGIKTGGRPNPVLEADSIRRPRFSDVPCNRRDATAVRYQTNDMIARIRHDQARLKSDDALGAVEPRKLTRPVDRASARRTFKTRNICGPARARIEFENPIVSTVGDIILIKKVDADPVRFEEIRRQDCIERSGRTDSDEKTTPPAQTSIAEQNVRKNMLV